MLGKSSGYTTRDFLSEGHAQGVISTDHTSRSMVKIGHQMLRFKFIILVVLWICGCPITVPSGPRRTEQGRQPQAPPSREETSNRGESRGEASCTVVPRGISAVSFRSDWRDTGHLQHRCHHHPPGPKGLYPQCSHHYSSSYNCH